MVSEGVGRKVEIIENSENLGFGTACIILFIFGKFFSFRSNIFDKISFAIALSLLSFMYLLMLSSINLFLSPGERNEEFQAIAEI